MKIKNFVAILIMGFMLVSCAPVAKVVPTETTIPTFTPTATVTPLPKATSTPDYTPTPTAIAGAKLLPFIESDGNGGWSINDSKFDPNKVVGFSADNEPGGGTYPTYGPEGVGETSIRCIAEITTPSGEMVTTGFLYWQRLTRLSPETWDGIKYLLGVGVGSGTQPGKIYCENSIKGEIEAGIYTNSINLIYNPNDMQGDIPSIMQYIIAELSPPQEFWVTGDISRLPIVNGKPFLLITSATFNP